MKNSLKVVSLGVALGAMCLAGCGSKEKVAKISVDGIMGD